MEWVLQKVRSSCFNGHADVTEKTEGQRPAASKESKSLNKAYMEKQ
jgi:hypothetical protein